LSRSDYLVRHGSAPRGTPGHRGRNQESEWGAFNADNEGQEEEEEEEEEIKEKKKK
jgi:hypothetical protein